MENMCQSCGMPMNEDKVRGTESDGSLSQDYCRYCYKDRKFTQPNITMDEMIEHNLKYLDEYNKVGEVEYTEDAARKEMQKFFPTLKRWQVAE